MRIRNWLVVSLSGFILAACQSPAPAPAGNAAGRPHNVIIFVGDGMRYGSVNATDTPALYELKTQGVDFANSHSLFPTVTTVNASAIATGHYIGDTGNFGNSFYVGTSRLAAIEDPMGIRTLNQQYGGNYLNERSLIAAAHAKGYSTAVVGKTGPAGVQDATLAGGIVVDEGTGTAEGLTLPADVVQAMAAAGLPASAPKRTMPATATVDWLVKTATDVMLPRFKAADKPFVMLFWCPDPDATQHGQKDVPGSVTPGVNGPTSKAAVANASSALARIRAALKAQGLEATTDIFVTADHGFSTVNRSIGGPDLPLGFLASDLSKELGQKLWTTGVAPAEVTAAKPLTGGSAIIGDDAAKPQVVFAANGGAQLIYLPDPATAKALAPKVVSFLTTQAYTGAIFIDQTTYGEQPGALDMKDVRLIGSAKTPKPAIVLSFRSVESGCGTEMCSTLITDSNYQTGQGTHGSLGRGETRNFMAAIGPDFKAGFVNTAPISNADIAPTLAHILQVDLGGVGKLKGRVITEALKGGADAKPATAVKKSRPAANGFITTLNMQRVGDAEYFDAAGAAGRAVGLKP
jgi:arylsulfatase A-like enzyme